MLLNMQMRGLKSGFDFLTQAAGFDIGESLYPFDSAQPYWQAFLVGVTNTLRVAVLAIILATVLGTLLGVRRVSSNALVRGLCLLADWKTTLATLVIAGVSPWLVAQLLNWALFKRSGGLTMRPAASMVLAPAGA